MARSRSATQGFFSSVPSSTHTASTSRAARVGSPDPISIDAVIGVADEGTAPCAGSQIVARRAGRHLGKRGIMRPMWATELRVIRGGVLLSFLYGGEAWAQGAPPTASFPEPAPTAAPAPAGPTVAPAPAPAPAPAAPPPAPAAAPAPAPAPAP